MSIDHDEARRIAEEAVCHGSGIIIPLAAAYLDIAARAEAVLRACDTVSGDEEREALRACLPGRTK